MNTKKRYDNSIFKAAIDENGFLVDTPVVARIGVQVYYDASGNEIREFRPSDEVFKESSLASFQGKPITLDHVTVNSDNAKDVVVGSISGKAEKMGNAVVAPIVIYDKGAIEEAMSGNAKELSVGYEAFIDMTPGWGDPLTGEYILKSDANHDAPDGYEEFDAIQRDIKVNHLAMVFRGRAGIAKLNLDGEQERPYTDTVKLTNEESNMTVKIKIDSAEVEVSKDVADHIGKLQAKAEQAGAKVDGLQAECDALKAKVDSIPDQIEAALKEAKEKADALGAVISFASGIGIKCDGLAEKEIKLAVIDEVLGIDAKEKSDAYINQSYEIARDSDKMAAQRIKVHGDKSDDKNDVADSGIPDPQARFRK